MTDPREAEAKTGSATFEFKGETFTVPLEFDDYPIGYIEAASDGLPLVIQARELLGPDQWARMRPLLSVGRDMRAVEKAISDAMGVDEGESPASSA
jgi:hypothetical protein